MKTKTLKNVKVTTSTKILITEDLYSGASSDQQSETINNSVNSTNVFCEISNNKFINIIEDEKNYISEKTDFKNCETIKAIGYSQSEWQEYKLYFDEKNNDIEILIEELKKTFTHKNDYFVEKIEVTEFLDKKSEEVIDVTSFSITWDEFPDQDEIIKSYNEIFGIDYDLIEVKID